MQPPNCEPHRELLGRQDFTSLFVEDQSCSPTSASGCDAGCSETGPCMQRLNGKRVRETEREGERGRGGERMERALLCSIYDQLDMCNLHLCVCPTSPLETSHANFNKRCWAARSGWDQPDFFFLKEEKFY